LLLRHSLMRRTLRQRRTLKAIFSVILAIRVTFT